MTTDNELIDAVIKVLREHLVLEDTSDADMLDLAEDILTAIEQAADKNADNDQPQGGL